MAAPYRWRNLTPLQRLDLLEWRKTHSHPWHSPPHRPDFDKSSFHITAACYEHAPIIGITTARLDAFTTELQNTVKPHVENIDAWCVLPNHYHLLVHTRNVARLLFELGRFHGRLARSWNQADAKQGRKVFFGAIERAMRSERHFWATLNYIHNNSVHHHYVKLWTDWPWSSAASYLDQIGKPEATRIWKEYPTRDYGAGWDDADL